MLWNPLLQRKTDEIKLVSVLLSTTQPRLSGFIFIIIIIIIIILITYFVKSNPCSSSSAAGLGGSSAAAAAAADRLLARVGLCTGDFPRAAAGGGLLLGGGRLPAPPAGLEGLRSKGTWWVGLSGVLPMSAYFQKGAGELVGMCWLGLCAVLGGASLGCTRCGAGVTKDALSSCRYDDVSVGEVGAASTVPSVLDAAGFRPRGRGLPSVPAPASSGRGFRAGRTGVRCESRTVERGWGEPDGDTFRLRAEAGSRAAMSLGPDVM